MKYLMMVLGTQADYEGMRGKASEASPAWTGEQLRAMYAHMGAINEDLARTGEMIDGRGLAEPARTRCVTAGADGEPVITDGPYPETEVLLAGYWLLDCASLDRVTEIAAQVARCPGPEGLTDHPVVIRPVLDGAEDI
ncbi:YciI family protein [Streptomyces sp. NPDC057438]|uniref:YciI family protein n=1 Tax=Streptomyces sp. NPDC057438 TaxID=3346133 RepID=UPI0036C76C92